MCLQSGEWCCHAGIPSVKMVRFMPCPAEHYSVFVLLLSCHSGPAAAQETAHISNSTAHSPPGSLLMQHRMLATNWHTQSPIGRKQRIKHKLQNRKTPIRAHTKVLTSSSVPSITRLTQAAQLDDDPSRASHSSPLAGALVHDLSLYAGLTTHGTSVPGRVRPLGPYRARKSAT